MGQRNIKNGGIEEGRKTNPTTAPIGQPPSPPDPDREAKKDMREHMRHLQKEAFQLANYYFVFQGVIFTAFYNIPSHLKCEFHWIPFTLSFLAGFLNLCALTTIALEYKSILDDMDKISTGPRNGRNNNIARNEEVSSWNNDERDRTRRRESIAVRCERHRRMLCVWFCMSLFVGFFVITLIGCWTITCAGGKDQNRA